MKAFGSSILSESAHTNSGISIVDENRVISLLEQDEMLLAKEVEKKRTVFADLVHATLHEYGCVSEETRHAFDTWTDTHKHREVLNENTIDPYTDDEAGYFREMDDTLTRYRIAMKEYESTAIGQEAMIFVSETTDTEKFEKLQAVNEAIGAKIKKVFYNTIAKIKEIFAKFMEKLRGNFTTTKNYLDKYKEIILKKPFANNKYGTQTLLDGIARISEQEVKRLDLANMGEKLDNLGTAFPECFPNNPAGKDTIAARTNIDTAEGQANFWKTYFCMQNHDAEITGPQFQKDIAKYWEFLYDIRNIERSIKKSIKDIEDTCNNVMKQAGADVAKDTGTANTESVYSYLYQKSFVLENGVLTEVEDRGPVNPQPAQTGNNPAAGDNVQKTYSQNMKNVSDGDADNAGTAKKSGRPIMDTRCNNYAICATTMLKAKMSACEFIRSECMGIIRKHVASYIGGGSNQTVQQQGNQQQQNTQQQQTQQNDIDARNARAAEYSARVANRRGGRRAR